VPTVAEARPDWWILTQVAQRMGYAAAFPYTAEAQIFREHARLSGFENGAGFEHTSQRAFDISALSTLSDAEYDTFEPMQWPINQHAPEGTVRLFTDGKFYTPSGKARMIAITPQLPTVATDADYPLVLNNGRIRDQWHTMTRSGKVPRLNAHLYESFVQVQARDAGAYQLQEGGLAKLTSRHGSMLARVQVSEDQRAGSVFVPIHWSESFARSSRVDALVAPITDPFSGQPEFKHGTVKVEPYQAAWQGFVLSRQRLDMVDASYCASSQRDGYWRQEIAGEHIPQDWSDWVKAAYKHDTDWLEYRDAAMGRYRAACLNNGRLEAAFFIAPDQRLPSREWLGSLFAKATLTPAELGGLLAARPPAGTAVDGGRIICACFSVGEKTILNSIRAQGLDNVEAVGVALKAGTNCGSCVPEIRRLLRK
jgi:assimilatory nitrate reductase catalytic subunit